MRVHTFALGPFATNTYVVEDDGMKEALLIDPTMGSRSVLAAILARKLRVALIVNTHGHIDHVYDDAYVKQKTGAPLAMHSGDAPLLGGLGAQAAMFGLPAPSAAQADRLLADGDTITFGALSFRVIHTPGHTPGGICLYGEGVLFAGDTLFAGGIGRTDLPGGNYETLIDSIASRLLALPDETVVYSGHGATTTIGEERENNPFLL